MIVVALQKSKYQTFFLRKQIATNLYTTKQLISGDKFQPNIV